MAEGGAYLEQVICWKYEGEFQGACSVQVKYSENIIGDSEMHAWGSLFQGKFDCSVKSETDMKEYNAAYIYQIFSSTSRVENQR